MRKSPRGNAMSNGSGCTSPSGLAAGAAAAALASFPPDGAIRTSSCKTCFRVTYFVSLAGEKKKPIVVYRVTRNENRDVSTKTRRGRLLFILPCLFVCWVECVQRVRFPLFLSHADYKMSHVLFKVPFILFFANVRIVRISTQKCKFSNSL